MQKKKIIRLRAGPRAPARTEAFPLAAKQPHGPGSDALGEVDAQKQGHGKRVRSPARPAVGFLLLHLVPRRCLPPRSGPRALHCLVIPAGQRRGETPESVGSFSSGHAELGPLPRPPARLLGSPAASPAEEAPQPRVRERSSAASRMGLRRAGAWETLSCWVGPCHAWGTFQVKGPDCGDRAVSFKRKSLLLTKLCSGGGSPGGESAIEAAAFVGSWE